MFSMLKRIGPLLLRGLFVCVVLPLPLGVADPRGGNELMAQPIPVPDKGDKPVPAKDKGWLGVQLTTIPKDQAKARGYDRDLVAVESVFTGSPAEASGFEGGDVILKYNGEEILEVKQLVGKVGSTSPGTKVEFEVLRGKEVRKVPLLLAIRPDRVELLRSQWLNKPAPAFKVTLAKDGKAMTLKDLKGKVVVLDFWATWCGPCRKSIPELNAIVDRHKGKGFVLVGISDEDAKTLNGFTDKTTLTYPVATDPERQANKDYQVSALPTTFLIDQEGIVRDVFIGAGDMKVLGERVDELLGKPL